MKSSICLDSIAFQLTPTRTRCDLVIAANGKTEKIASGLLDPFLAHLKAAQEQSGKGGYSIVLAPNRESDTPWFTKGTVERFVRFVSTPEILERVYTIESEILQIEKAISLQSSNDVGLNNDALKTEVSFEGRKPVSGSNDEKAIVLYQPTNHQAEEDGSNALEQNSKVQLVQVLETRKDVLQKEQGMAFARAVAASFDIDNIAALLVFAEYFGASRMIDACKKFMHLWKAKHESGQWVEVGAAEAMSYRADVPSTNAAGIVFHSSNESAQGEVVAERNGKSGHHQQSPPYPMFAPYQMNSHSNGMPIFPPYPMQGMAYYQNYPGVNMSFHPPYPPVDDPRLNSGHRTRRRRHSMDNGDMSAQSDTQYDEDRGEDTDEDVSETSRGRKKGGKSSRKQAKNVVIRNINYIASAKHGSENSDPQSCSGSGTDDGDDDEGDIKGDETRISRKKGVNQMSENPPKSSAGNDGNWQAFQNFLLTDADESSKTVNDMFEMEGKVQGRKRQTAIGDASALRRHSMGGSEDVGFHDRFDVSGESGSLPRVSRRPGDTVMDHVFNRQGKPTDSAGSSLDPAMLNGFQGSANNNNRQSSHGMADESFVVLHGASYLDRVSGDGRTVMNMDFQKADNHTIDTNQSNYEPNDLNLMPNRVINEGQSGYDPAIDYEMQSRVKEIAQQSGDSKKVTSGTKQGTKKTAKDQKLKGERNPASTKREKPSKLSPLEDARARAEKLRAFKADLQKLKKEQEEEQLKRLEALKLERQKRIAARSGPTVPQSPSSSQLSRKQLPKLSPISRKGSKFSDTDPGSSSPLQRSTLKLTPKVSSNSGKISKPVRSNSGSQSKGNRLTRSASSLSMRKEENNGPTPESKATIASLRRLSEPKNSAHHVSSGKTRIADVALSKHRVAEKAEIKKMPIKKKIINKDKSQKPSAEILSIVPVVPRDGDDIIIVEKNVVMLELEKPATQGLHQPEDETSAHHMQRNIDKDQAGKLLEDAPIPSPASPIVVKEVDCEPSNREGRGHSHTSVKESQGLSPNVPNVDTTENPYQAPYARNSSIEDPCMTKSGSGQALPSSFSSSTLVSDGQRQDLVSQAASGKHQGKNSSKGFKRLLFGKRSSAASQTSIDLDKASLDDSLAADNASNGSSSDGLKLKNILIQEESSTPKKSSRSFSLLSPFKSKSSEKKSVT